MNGKERLQRTLRCEVTDRVPWVPFVGCHGGALLGMTATDYLRCEASLVRGVEAAIDRYHPDGIPVAFDLQLEAEVLGCELSWADQTPPAVRSHPLSNGGRLEDLRVPTPACGRIKTVLAAARRLTQAHEDIAFYGLVTGPFTLALHLLGTDIFMQMFDAPDYVGRVMAFCRDVGIAMSGYYLDAGCSIVAMVDPMTSQISADQFREFVTPYATPIFAAIRETGQMDDREMYQVFNMGHRLELYCKPQAVSAILETCQSWHLEARIVGYTEKSGYDGREVVIKDHGQTLSYRSR